MADEHEKIYDRVNDNSKRLTVLETLYKSDAVENKQTHARIERKVDEVADLVSGFRYMIRGAQWVAGLLFGLWVWLIHDMDAIRRFFTR